MIRDKFAMECIHFNMPAKPYIDPSRLKMEWRVKKILDSDDFKELFHASYDLETKSLHFYCTNDQDFIGNHNFSFLNYEPSYVEKNIIVDRKDASVSNASSFYVNVIGGPLDQKLGYSHFFVPKETVFKYIGRHMRDNLRYD